MEDQSHDLNQTLKTNQLFSKSFDTKVKGAISSPYWLTQKGNQGMYITDKTEWIGAAKSPAAYQATLDLSIEGKKLEIGLPLKFRRTDPVKGEVITPFHILPEAALQLEAPVFLFATDQSRKVKVSVKNLGPKVEGTLELKTPKSWEVNPKSVEVSLSGKGNESDFYFDIKAPPETTVGQLRPQLQTQTKKIQASLQEIAYDHIPKQFLVSPADPKW